MKNKIIGYSFLHSHPGMQNQKDLDTDHVIVDRKDWEAVVDFFHKHPEFITEVIESQPLSSLDVNPLLKLIPSKEYGIVWPTTKEFVKPINPEEGD